MSAPSGRIKKFVSALLPNFNPRKDKSAWVNIIGYPLVGVYFYLMFGTNLLETTYWGQVLQSAINQLFSLVLWLVIAIYFKNDGCIKFALIVIILNLIACPVMMILNGVDANGLGKTIACMLIVIVFYIAARTHRNSGNSDKPSSESVADDVPSP